MKVKKSSKEAITGPLLKDLVQRDEANAKINRENVSVGSKPLPAPAQYEDAGEGYNQDFTFPQQ